MDLVDEENVSFDQVRQHRGEVPGPLERGAGRDPQGGTHLPRDDHCQRGLAQARWTRQQNVVGGATTAARRLQHQLQLFAHPRLTDEVAERLGTKAVVEVAVCRDPAGVDGSVDRFRVGDRVTRFADAVEVVDAVGSHRVLPNDASEARRTVAESAFG